MDLVKKKTVNFDLDTYERLSKLAAQLRMDNPGGGFVSMSAAVAVLLDGREERQAVVESNEWNDSKVVLPALGDKLLVEFPSGKTHRAIYYEDNGFEVYLEKGEGVSKSGFYPFSRMTCIRWKLNDFKEPENESE